MLLLEVSAKETFYVEHMFLTVVAELLQRVDIEDDVPKVSKEGVTPQKKGCNVT